MEPILLDVPEELATERLKLRVPRFNDGKMINQAIVESAVELAKWMPWANPTPDVANTEKWVRTAVAKFALRQEFHFLLFVKSGGGYIGTCGMHRFDAKIPMIEIGYWLRTPDCGNGYMSEAARAITTFALETLKCERAEIRCDARNVRSARVAELAGYTHEGTLRADSRDHHGELRDTRIYAMLRGSAR
jgi:RimJ/RimL family protein N-acetyltransferase